MSNESEADFWGGDGLCGGWVGSRERGPTTAVLWGTGAARMEVWVLEQKWSQ